MAIELSLKLRCEDSLRANFIKVIPSVDKKIKMMALTFNQTQVVL
jgi:hypothetical protein